MAVATTKGAKRKSTDTVEGSLKKLKVAKSAERPLPLKSALKKSGGDASISKSAKHVKASKSKDVTPAIEKPVEPVQDDEFLFDDEEEEDAEGESTGAALTPDQTAALLAGFSDSDEEEDADAIPVDELPKAPVSDALTSAVTHEPNPETTPGVVYVGRIPHGFYEHQMRAYFSQFGKITHLRLARSKKTARSKHHAFIEFASASVADIVAKTMDKYLLFNHILQVRRVPSDQVKETMWRGEGRRRRAMPMNRIEGTKLRKGTTKEGWDKRIDRENHRRQSKAAKLKEIGYEFEAPTIKRVGQANETTTIGASAEQQLLGDIADAADAVEAPALESESAKSKKRATTVADNGEPRKLKKSKRKA